MLLSGYLAERTSKTEHTEIVHVADCSKSPRKV